MKLSLPRADLIAYWSARLDVGFPDGKRHDVARVVDAALERLEYCFSWISLPRYTIDGEPAYDHLHGDQNAAFLYLCSNTAFRLRDDDALAQKFFLLNKANSGMVCMYDTELPQVFALIHTVGLVLGKAAYGERFAVFQNVTIGGDRGALPTIGEGVVVYGGAIVAGETELGSGCVVEGNSAVIHTKIEADTIIAGRSPDLHLRPRKRDITGRYFFETRPRT